MKLSKKIKKKKIKKYIKTEKIPPKKNLKKKKLKKKNVTSSPSHHPSFNKIRNNIRLRTFSSRCSRSRIWINKPSRST